MGLFKKLAAVGLLLFLCAGYAWAAPAETGGAVLVIQQKEGETIPGGSVRLYRVRQIGERVTLTEDFASSGVVIEDIYSPELAKTLADFAFERRIYGMESAISQEGTALFSNLSDGLYLAVQQKAAEGYMAWNPFFICIQGGSVTVKPKMEPETETPGNPTVPQTGDDTSLFLWLAAFALSTMGIGLLLYYRGKNRYRNGK